MGARFDLLSAAGQNVLELSLHHLVAGETQPRGKARPVAVDLAKHGAAALLGARDHAVDALDVFNPVRQGLRDDVLHGEAGLVKRPSTCLTRSPSRLAHPAAISLTLPSGRADENTRTSPSGAAVSSR